MLQFYEFPLFENIYGPGRELLGFLLPDLDFVELGHHERVVVEQHAFRTRSGFDYGRVFSVVVGIAFVYFEQMEKEPVGEIGYRR